MMLSPKCNFIGVYLRFLSRTTPIYKALLFLCKNKIFYGMVLLIDFIMWKGLIFHTMEVATGP